MFERDVSGLPAGAFYAESRGRPEKVILTLIMMSQLAGLREMASSIAAGRIPIALEARPTA